MHKKLIKTRKETYPQRGDNNSVNERLCMLECIIAAQSAQIGKLLLQGAKIMATLDEILTSVESEDAVDDSIIALLKGIKKQLDDVLAGGLTAAQQAKVDAIFAKVEASKAKVEAAVLENTPSEPPA